MAAVRARAEGAAVDAGQLLGVGAITCQQEKSIVKCRGSVPKKGEKTVGQRFLGFESAGGKKGGAWSLSCAFGRQELGRRASMSRLELDTASANETVARHAVGDLAATLAAVGATKGDTRKTGAAERIRDQLQ